MVRAAGAAIILLLPVHAAAQSVELLHAFTPTAKFPLSGLAEAADGSLYGTLYAGGRQGVVVKLTSGGAVVTVIHRFEDLSAPYRSLTRGLDGGIYTVSAAGGGDDVGAVYRIDPATGDVRTLYTGLATDGRLVPGPLAGADGRIYVMASGGERAVGTSTVLAIDPVTGAATRQPGFGYGERTILAEGPDGLLYATQEGSNGYVYRLNRTTGDISLITGLPGNAQPLGLTRTSDGRLYGVTHAGGAENAGTVFRVDPATGAATTVLDVRPSLGHGKGPHTRLVEGIDGCLYGISESDAHSGQPGEFNSIFRVRRLPGDAHVLEVVLAYSPTSTPQLSELLQASDGYIYGTQFSDPLRPGGLVYRFNPLGGGPSGNPFGYAVRAEFGAPVVPARPAGPPVQAGNGFLYSVAQDGGLALGRGSIIRIDPGTGAVAAVRAIPPPALCFSARSSGLVRASDGLLYGTTTCGDSGSIYRFDPATGTATTLLTQTLPSMFYPYGLHGLVRLPGGGLYGLRTREHAMEVYRFDPQAGTMTVLADLRMDTTAAWPEPTLTATRDGVLYAVSVAIAGGGSPRDGEISDGETRLVRIDPSTGATGIVSTLPSAQMASAAPVEAADGRLLLPFTDGNVWRVMAFNRATAVWSTLCQVTSKRPLVSLTVEPGGRIFGVLRGHYDQNHATATLVECDPATGALLTRHDFSPLEGLPVGGFAWAGDGLAYGVTEFGSTGGGSVVRFAAAGSLSSVDTDGDGLPNAWESANGLDPMSAAGDDGAAADPDGDGRTNAQELADGTHPRGVVTRYLAEGATGPFFDTRIALANPFAEAASVLVRFLPDGGSVISHRLSVPGRSRRTIDPETLPGLAHASFSTVIEADRMIGVDRTMSWDAGRYGSHSETAVVAPSTTWYLAEGSTSGDFALFYLLQNPNATAVSATVRYLRPSGAPIDRPIVLPANSRTTIPVDAAGPELANTDVSAVITAAAPIIVERAMYMNRPGQPFGAGHDSAGVTAPALEWFLAEGATGSYFDLFVLVANPNPTPAQITAEYLRVGGGVLTKTYTVPANARFTIWVDDETIPAGSGQKPLANASLSTTIRSTNGVPVVVERTMWWPGPGVTADYWIEAHNSPGTTATATRWMAADVETGGPDGAETYVLIANPSPRAGQARIGCLTEDGAGQWVDLDLPAQSRTTVPIAGTFAAVPSRAGVVVESLGLDPVPLVVERATYASPGGVFWASGTNALATPLP